MDAVVDILNTHGRKLATAASVAIVILASLSVADTVLFFVENTQDDEIAPRAASVAKPAADNTPDVDLAALNLFGTVENPGPAQQVVDAPETKLNLELQGVFTADNPDDSTAIVAERNKTGELFQIGDRLPGNAILEAVYPNHILINRGGRVEKLAFPDSSLREQFSRRQAPAAARLPSATPAPDLGRREDATTRLRELRERLADRRREAAERRANAGSGTPSSESVQQRIETYKERIRENPQEVLNELGVSPVSSGEAKGYRVSGNIPEAAMKQAGLRQGDVILSVNGQPVGNVANDQAMIDQAMAAGRVRVEVQRADRRFYLTVPIP